MESGKIISYAILIALIGITNAGAAPDPMADKYVDDLAGNGLDVEEIMLGTPGFRDIVVTNAELGYPPSFGGMVYMNDPNDPGTFYQEPTPPIMWGGY